MGHVHPNAHPTAVCNLKHLFATNFIALMLRAICGGDLVGDLATHQRLGGTLQVFGWGAEELMSRASMPNARPASCRNL